MFFGKISDSVKGCEPLVVIVQVMGTAFDNENLIGLALPFAKLFQIISVGNVVDLVIIPVDDERIGLIPNSWKPVRRGWCLGSVGFVEEMKEKLEELAKKPRDRENWSGEAVEEMEEERAIRLLKEGIKRLGISSLEKVKGADRFLLARWLRKESRISIKWLAALFGLKTQGGMRYSIWQMGKKIKTNPVFQKKWKRITR